MCRPGRHHLRRRGRCHLLGRTRGHRWSRPSSAMPACTGRTDPACPDRPTSTASSTPPPGAPLAFAALEMAVADTHLRAGRSSLADSSGWRVDRWISERWSGGPSSTEALVADVASLADEGYARVKMKIGPGWDRRAGRGRATRSVPGIRVAGRRQRLVPGGGPAIISPSSTGSGCSASSNRSTGTTWPPTPDWPPGRPPRSASTRASTPRTRSAGRWRPGRARWCASSRPGWGGSARPSSWSRRVRRPGSRCGWEGCSSPATPGG